jgi:hypothetical protein
MPHPLQTRLAAAWALAVLAACSTPQPPPVAAIAAPAFLKDAPDEVHNAIPTNFTQAKAGETPPPDPLLTLSGKPVRTAADWSRLRRPEVKALLEDNQFGHTPTAAVSTTYDVWDKATPAFDGLATRRQATLHFTSARGKADIDVLLYTPTAATGPSPVIVMLNFSPNIVMVDDPGVREVTGWDASGKQIPGHTARAIARPDVKGFLAHGYAVALVYYGQIDPDVAGQADKGVRALFGSVDETNRAPTDWGSVGAWAWGVSQVVTWLQSEDAIDDSKIALYGISRLGKTVLWAGATDSRIAITIASCSGEGGAALSRRNYGETIAHVAAAFPYWFAPRWRDFAANPAAAPVDANLVLSLIAPRPLLLITASEDSWSDPYGEFLAARSASRVYALFGKSGIANAAYPPLDTPILTDIGFVTHKGPHGPAPSDLKTMLDFMDKYFRP